MLNYWYKVISVILRHVPFALTGSEMPITLIQGSDMRFGHLLYVSGSKKEIWSDCQCVTNIV